MIHQRRIGQSPLRRLSYGLLRRQTCYAGWAKELHATFRHHFVKRWVPPGRRPLRIHELRKSTGFANVTGQYCKDIRLIVLTYFRSSLTLREPMNQPCGSCDGATPCVAWVHRHTRSRYSRSREPMNLDIASSQK